MLFIKSINFFFIIRMDSLGQGFEKACRQINFIYELIPFPIEEKIKIKSARNPGARQASEGNYFSARSFLILAVMAASSPEPTLMS